MLNTEQRERSLARGRRVTGVVATVLFVAVVAVTGVGVTAAAESDDAFVRFLGGILFVLMIAAVVLFMTTLAGAAFAAGERRAARRRR